MWRWVLLNGFGVVVGCLWWLVSGVWFGLMGLVDASKAKTPIFTRRSKAGVSSRGVVQTEHAGEAGALRVLIIALKLWGGLIKTIQQ